MDKTMLRRVLWEFLRPLITLITNLINPEIGEEWLVELKKFNRKEPCWVTVTKTVEVVKVYLRRLYETRTIKVCDKAFFVYEIIKDGTFNQFFGSLGDDMNRLALSSREEVDEFCKFHPLKLMREGYATFFLYKKEEEFFVAVVYAYDRINVDVHPLGFGVSGAFWRAECRHRIVVPQL